jgi:hypothetical protein
MSKKLLTLKQLIGLYLTIFGLVLVLKILINIHIFNIVMLLLIIPGLDLIVRALVKTKNRSMIIPGVIILLSSLFGLVYNILLLPNGITLVKVWPAIGVIPSISMVMYYIVSPKKSAAVIIPALFIFLLSAIMILFTTSIITMSFEKFILFLIAGMIMLTGFYLLFAKRIHKIQDQIEQKIHQSNDQ